MASPPAKSRRDACPTRYAGPRGLPSAQQDVRGTGVPFPRARSCLLSAASR